MRVTRAPVAVHSSPELGTAVAYGFMDSLAPAVVSGPTSMRTLALARPPTRPLGPCIGVPRGPAYTPYCCLIPFRCRYGQVTLT